MKGQRALLWPIDSPTDDDILELGNDNARWTWVILLGEAKRRDWSFDSEAQIKHLLGSRYRHVVAFRAARLLDGMAVADPQRWGGGAEADRRRANAEAQQRHRSKLKEGPVSDDGHTAQMTVTSLVRASEPEQNHTEAPLPPDRGEASAAKPQQDEDEDEADDWTYREELGTEWSEKLQRARALPEPSPDTGAALEVRVNRLGKVIQEMLHDRKLTASWQQIRTMLTEYPGATVEDVTGAVDEALKTEGKELRHPIAYITAEYEKGGIPLLEKHRRRRGEKREHDAVAEYAALPESPEVKARVASLADKFDATGVKEIAHV